MGRQFYCKIGAAAKWPDVQSLPTVTVATFGTRGVAGVVHTACKAERLGTSRCNLIASCDLFHPLRWLARRQAASSVAGAPRRPSMPARRRVRAPADRRPVVAAPAAGAGARRHAAPQALARLGAGAAALHHARRRRRRRRCSPPGLLYGARGGVPGFGWYDRALGRQVRMDLAEDVQRARADARRRSPPAPRRRHQLRHHLAGRRRRRLLQRRPLQLRRHLDRQAGAQRLRQAGLDGAPACVIAGKVASRFVLELGVGLWDFRAGAGASTRRASSGASSTCACSSPSSCATSRRKARSLDILRGVPRIFIDYLGYDEYAHRRGPDSELALYNLQGIDGAIARSSRAVARRARVSLRHLRLLRSRAAGDDAVRAHRRARAATTSSSSTRAPPSAAA